MPDPVETEEAVAVVGLLNLDAPALKIDDAATIPREQAVAIMDIAANAKRLGIEFDAIDAVRRGVDPAALRAAVLAAKAARDEAAVIVVARPTPNTTGVAINPSRSGSGIVDEARRTAAEQIASRSRNR